MTDKELRAAIKAVGGDLRGLRTTEQLTKRLTELRFALPTAPALADRETPPIVRTTNRVSVLPDEPLPVPQPNALNGTLGMIGAAPVTKPPFGSISQQDILDATERHRRQGMDVRFVENCWEFKYGKRMDSGNMAMPMKVILERADFVCLGRPLPVVNPVIVPTVPVPDLVP